MAHSTGISSGPNISPYLAHVHIVTSDGAGTAINRSRPLHHQRVISDFSGAQVIGWTWVRKSAISSIHFNSNKCCSGFSLDKVFIVVLVAWSYGEISFHLGHTHFGFKSKFRCGNL